MDRKHNILDRYLINSKFLTCRNITISNNVNNMCGPLAQSVEQFPFKEWVASSNLAGLTNDYE